MIWKILSVAFFILIFVLVPFTVDYSIERYSGFDRYVKFDSFEAFDVPVGQNYSQILLVRKSNSPYNLDLDRELFLVKVDENRSVFSGGNDDIVFELGDRANTIRYSLPQNIKQGEYKWVNTYTLKTERGFIKRTTIETNTFYIYR